MTCRVHGIRGCTICPPARYRTIVADPPWDQGTTGHGMTEGFGRHQIERAEPGYTAMPYPSMSVEEIAALPICDLAEPDAHLYIWTTNKYLREIWGVAEAWGFVPSCVLAWCKTPVTVAIGGAFRSNVEYCLFARRGRLAAIGISETRWFTWPRRRGAPVGRGERRSTMHSAKPEAFLDLVEQVSPGPYLELFARRQRLGWDTWGNEALEHVTMRGGGAA